MFPNELKQMIHRREIPKFLIFLDNDPYQSFIYKGQIAKIVGLPTNYYADLEDALYDASMLLSEDCMYVVQIDVSTTKGFNGQAEKNKTLLNALKELDKYVIILFENYDNKKSSLLSSFKDDIVIFNKQNTNALYDYITKICVANKTTLPQAEILALIEKSNNDLGVIVNTLEQMCILNKIGYDASSFELCDYRKGDLFVLIDKILAQDKTAWEYSTLVKDSPSVIAYNLYRKARERFMTTNSSYYSKLMEICEKVFNGINDGSIKDSYALKYLIYSSLN